MTSCIAEGCERPHRSRGYCDRHYWHAKKRGEFEGVLAPRFNAQRRFWSKVEKTPTCWLWTAATFVDGYGNFRFEGKNRRAHRVSWQWMHGPIADGLVVDHLCRVRNCVNPDHMELVTDRENVRRGIGPTAIAARRTACVNGHPFDEQNTVIAATGQRACRECRRQTSRRFRARHKGAA